MWIYIVVFDSSVIMTGFRATGASKLRAVPSWDHSPVLLTRFWQMIRPEPNSSAIRLSRYLSACRLNTGLMVVMSSLKQGIGDGTGQIEYIDRQENIIALGPGLPV